MAKRKEEENIEEKEEKEEKGGKGRGWLLYALLLPTLTLLAFALVRFVIGPLFPPPGAPGEEEPRVKPHLGTIISLNPIIVNLAGTGGRRYLKAKVELEVPEEEEIVEMVRAREPHLLDSLIDILSRKQLKDVISPEGRNRLRREIGKRFAKELGAGVVKRILITEFVIQ